MLRLPISEPAKLACCLSMILKAGSQHPGAWFEIEPMGCSAENTRGAAAGGDGKLGRTSRTFSEGKA